MSLLDDMKKAQELEKSVPTQAKSSSIGNNIYLDENISLTLNGKNIGTLSSISSKVKCDCPAPHNHSDGGKGYGYAHTVQLGGGEWGIKCSGASCDGVTYLPNKELSHEDKIAYAISQNEPPSEVLEQQAEQYAQPSSKVYTPINSITTPMRHILKVVSNSNT